MQLHTNEISFEYHGAVTLLDIQGDITSFSEPFLTKAYQNDQLAQGASHILLNFVTDAYINSGGIAVLIQILSQTKENNQKIGIAGVSHHYKKILTMVGITKFAEIPRHGRKRYPDDGLKKVDPISIPKIICKLCFSKHTPFFLSDLCDLSGELLHMTILYPAKSNS